MDSTCHPAPRTGARERILRIGGLLPMTTLDYPGQLACVVFCQGCAWNCSYCHNPELICSTREPAMSWEHVLDFLERRHGLLQAVVFSGGEATLQLALPEAMREVRARGFKVGLHSAGIRPGTLRRVLPLCDWVGFDVKALEEDVELITGVTGSGRANWLSLEMVLASGIDYECRTTVHWQLFDCQRLQRLGERLAALGVRYFAVQLARSGNMLDMSLGASVAPPEAAALWVYFKQLFERFELRDA